MMNILITGTHSYIGSSLTEYLSRWPDNYHTSAISLRNDAWQSESFSAFGAVFHAAGLAHDSAKHTLKDDYFRVNSQLTYDTALKAKREGVRQFVFMSSSIVYGKSAPIGHEKIITRDSPVNPESYYGESKVKAEELLMSLNDEGFRVCILRCPMVYGRGSKGNYPLLSKLARKLPIFPRVRNSRSMLYVKNLAEFVRLVIQNQEQGIFWPQNAEYSDTSELVRMIAETHGRKIKLLGGCEFPLRLLAHVTPLVNKAFGSLTYLQELSEYPQNYRLFTLKDSIRETEA